MHAKRRVSLPTPLGMTFRSPRSSLLHDCISVLFHNSNNLTFRKKAVSLSVSLHQAILERLRVYLTIQRNDAIYRSGRRSKHPIRTAPELYIPRTVRHANIDPSFYCNNSKPCCESCTVSRDAHDEQGWAEFSIAPLILHSALNVCTAARPPDAHVHTPYATT